MKTRCVAIVALALLAGTVYAEGAVEKADQAMNVGDARTAKYVFVFIGDGLATPQITAAEAFLGEVEDDLIGIRQLNFTEFPAQGLTTTYSADRYITDSAAAGTAIATGYKTNGGVIAMDPGVSVDYPTIAEMAKDAGMKVGIVSSVNIDHATPATFYAHEPSRNNYYNIGVQMANSNFDYYGGGRVRLSKTPDGEPTVLDIMADNGWTIAGTRNEFLALRPTDAQVFAYDYGFIGDALEYEIDRENDDISLAEFTAKGIELLDNEDGFFMMVEGGKIDWAGHANDAVANIYDTFAFAEAIGEAIAFYNAHPDETLIVVTGDHECGGLSIGFAGTAYDTGFSHLANQQVSFEWFDVNVLAPYKASAGDDAELADLIDEIERYFGLTDLNEYEAARLETAFAESMQSREERSSDAETYLLYGGYEPLTVTITHLLNQRAGLAWATYSHTGIPVPTFAIGVGQEQFNGYYDNTDIFHFTVDAMGLSTTVASK